MAKNNTDKTTAPADPSAEAIAAKVAAGLTRDQAIEVLKAQAANDAEK